jgi:gamma-glutamylcyclotransferase (GGCT)/AIG2-like uncharacterized protein YtfP
MRNTFYRPSEVNHEECARITENMRETLIAVVNGTIHPEEALEQARWLVNQAGVTNPDLAFWGYFEPDDMPHDAMLDYIYTPTYLAVSILANVFMRLPSRAIKIDGFIGILTKGLNAATGRDFEGSGYESVSGLLDTLEIFADGRMVDFIDAYPDFSPSFTRLLKESEAFISEKIREGKLSGIWGEDYLKSAWAVMDKIRKSRVKTKVFVYGTLMSGRSNSFLMGDSRFLGEASVSGYSMYEPSWYPGVTRDPDGSVLGELYEVNLDTMKKLNELEGEGSLYELDYADVITGGSLVPGVAIYVYLHDVKKETHVKLANQPWRER